MSNPFQLTFRLKQHTPIIHFQHDQDGATLRATELKPALDKYVISKLGGWGKTKIEWRVGKNLSQASQNSLDYKVHIQPLGKPSFYIVASNPPSNQNDPNRSYKASRLGAEYIGQTQYFADNQFIDKDIEKWRSIRRSIMYPGVVVKLSFQNLSLKREVEQHLKAFFCHHSFGTRKSKGFGCFLPDQISDDDVLKILTNPENTEIAGVFQVSKKDDWATKVIWIAKNYSLLKKGQGGREQGGYKKAKIWDYLCEAKNVSWEKRAIKTHILINNPSLFDALQNETNQIAPGENQNVNNSDIKNAKEHMYVRALLGLAEQYEFLKKNKDRLKVRIADTLKFSNDEYIRSVALDRFTSPLRFVITDTSVFVIASSIPGELYEYTLPQSNKVQAREFRFTIDEMSTHKYFDLKVPRGFQTSTFVEKAGLFGKNLKRSHP